MCGRRKAFQSLVLRLLEPLTPNIACSFLLTPNRYEMDSFPSSFEDDIIYSLKKKMKLQIIQSEQSGSWRGKSQGQTVRQIILDSDRFYKPSRGKKKLLRKPPRRIESFLWRSDCDWKKNLKNFEKIHYSQETVEFFPDYRVFINEEKRALEREGEGSEVAVFCSCEDESSGMNSFVSLTSLTPSLSFSQFEVCFDGFK